MNYSADNLYGYIDILAKTQQEMRFSHHTKIYLETALLKMAQYSGGGEVVHSQAGTVVDPQLVEKVATLERMVQNLTQQIQNGVQPANAPQTKEAPRPRVKSQNYNAPIGRIKEVLKGATKKDIQAIKNAWVQVLRSTSKITSSTFCGSRTSCGFI